MLTKAEDYKYQSVEGVDVSGTPMFSPSWTDKSFRYRDALYLAEAATCAGRIHSNYANYTLQIRDPKQLNQDCQKLCRDIQTEYNNMRTSESGLELTVVNPDGTIPDIGVVSNSTDLLTSTQFKNAMALPALGYDEVVQPFDGVMRLSDMRNAFEITNRIRRRVNNFFRMKNIFRTDYHQTIINRHNGEQTGYGEYDGYSSYFSGNQAGYRFYEGRTGDDKPYTNEDETRQVYKFSFTPQNFAKSVTVKSILFSVWTHDTEKQKFVFFPVNQTLTGAGEFATISLDADFIKQYVSALGVNPKDYYIQAQIKAADVVFNRLSDIP